MSLDPQDEIKKDIILIVVGSEQFFIERSKLLTYPDTLLGKIALDEKQNTIHIDRDPKLFACIFNFYENGFVENPENISYKVFDDELKFYLMPRDSKTLFSVDKEYMTSFNEDIKKELEPKAKVTGKRKRESVEYIKKGIIDELASINERQEELHDSLKQIEWISKFNEINSRKKEKNNITYIPTFVKSHVREKILKFKQRKIYPGGINDLRNWNPNRDLPHVPGNVETVSQKILPDVVNLHFDDEYGIDFGDWHTSEYFPEDDSDMPLELDSRLLEGVHREEYEYWKKIVGDKNIRIIQIFNIINSAIDNTYVDDGKDGFIDKKPLIDTDSILYKCEDERLTYHFTFGVNIHISEDSYITRPVIDKELRKNILNCLTAKEIIKHANFPLGYERNGVKRNELFDPFPDLKDKNEEIWEWPDHFFQAYSRTYLIEIKH